MEAAAYSLFAANGWVMFPGAGVLQRNDPQTGLVEVDGLEVDRLELESVVGIISPSRAC